MVLIDTHCHLDDARFAGDRDAVVARAVATGVTATVIPATTAASARGALDLAARLAGRLDARSDARLEAAPALPPSVARIAGGLAVGVAVGVHPLWCAEAGPLPETLAQLRDLVQASAVVAVGEIGLDYARGPDRALQICWLDAQLDLAAATGLPVILHNRDATPDLLERLRAWTERAPLPTPPGVFHAFSGDRAAADWGLAAGFYLGIGGMITFRRSHELRAVAAAAPAARLLLETDAPYLAPEPLRGRRNEPAFVRHVAARLAAERGSGIEQIALQTTSNALHLFPRLAAQAAAT